MASFTNRATLTYNGQVLSSNIVSGEIVEVLSASKTAITDGYALGDTVTYAIGIVNSGSSPFNGLSVSDNMGAYQTGTSATAYPLTYVSGSVRLFVNGVLQSAPSVTPGPPTVFSGINLPADSSAVLIYDAVVNSYASPETDATIDNTATISGAGLSTPVTASQSITASDTPQLSISKSVSPSSVAENGELTYTFIITNTGNAPAQTSDNAVITDTFNPILSNLSVTFNSTPWSSPTNYTYDEGSGLFTTAANQITVPAATYSQDSSTGEWTVTPGESRLVVSGTV